MKNPFMKKIRPEQKHYDDNFDNDFDRGDDYEDDGIVEDLDSSPSAMPQQEAPVKRPTKSAVSGNRLKVLKPRSFDDSSSIVDYLVDGYTVVLNIEAMDRAEVLRMVDYLGGALDVLGGDMRRVSGTTLVCSPQSVSMSSEIDGEGFEEL